jgi:peptidyl-prolyl cis-trans isomerase SDCCAG10
MPNLFQIKKAIQQKHLHFRQMNLPDDVKEYWGFYLLKGSHVKLTVCSRYEGASFIVVKSLKVNKTWDTKA